MCVCVYHSKMPVSVSISITCKHLLIICEQMLAVGLFPSVIPVTVCAWPRHCTEMCSWLFPLPDNSNFLDRLNMFEDNCKKKKLTEPSPVWRDSLLRWYFSPIKKICSGSCTACIPHIVIQGSYCSLYVLIWASSGACQHGVQHRLQTHPGTRANV